MKREITFCSAPFFRVFSRCFPKRRKVVSWRRFSFFFIQKKEKGRNERIRSRTDKKGKKKGWERKLEKEKKKEETHLLLSFSLLQNQRKGNMLPAQKEKNVSLLLFLFLFSPLLARFCSPYQLLCQSADDGNGHAVANPLIYAQHMDRTGQKKKAIPLLIEIRGFLA